MLWNLSACEVRIPPKTIIGNVQTAEIAPNMKALDHACKILPAKEQKGPSKVSWSSCSNSPENELTQLTPISLHPALEHDVLDKVDLLGCTKWYPEDKQEVRKILREYADVFAKDNHD